jgi:acyl-CoA reductase-like NAD-dependent aldehyde dehydrogenase
MEESGMQEGVFNVVIGSGSVVGDMIVSHPDCKKISFTGSPEVGNSITKKAGIKKVTLELGNNSATIIDEDANLKKAAAKCASSAFANSGQVCISLQRIYVHKNVLNEFKEHFLQEVKKLKFGNPLEKDCDVGPMIDEKEAERAESWINEAVNQGAKIILGGKRDGRMLEPTVLSDVTDEMKVMCMEIFAPVVSVVEFDDFYEVVKKVENSEYGLQAGIYTNNINKAYYAVDNINVGGVMINDTSIFRVDHMPYGGNKMSGIGREGVKFAIEDMTNIKMIMFNLN